MGFFDFLKGDTTNQQDSEYQGFVEPTSPDLISRRNDLLKTIQEGDFSKLPEISQKDIPIILKKNEKCYAIIGNMPYGETVTIRKGSGYYGGIRRGTGHGSSIGAGMFSSTSTPTTEIHYTDVGTFVLTNQKIVFIGSKKTIQYSLDKIINVKAVPEQYVVIHRSNKSTPDYFFGNYDNRLLAAVIEGLIRENTLGTQNPPPDSRTPEVKPIPEPKSIEPSLFPASPRYDMIASSEGSRSAPPQKNVTEDIPRQQVSEKSEVIQQSPEVIAVKPAIAVQSQKQFSTFVDETLPNSNAYSVEELEKIAYDNGINEIYSFLNSQASTFFEGYTRNRTSICFFVRNTLGFNRLDVFNLIPTKSNSKDGLKFQVYTFVLAEYFKKDPKVIIDLLPSNKKEWHWRKQERKDTTGFEGFFTNLDEAKKFVEGLKK
jgi:hypothetical protein